MGRLLGTDKLQRVHPTLDGFVRQWVEDSALDWMVVTGARTQAEVDAKWAEGRTKPGPHAGETGYPELGLTVTQVRTLHDAPHAVRVTPEGLYACAVDLQFLASPGKLSEGKTLTDVATYRGYGLAGEKAGFVWGGRFSKVDQAHLELVSWRSYALPSLRLFT